ncbi:MAG: hypothetical protein HW399_283 [Dehalococcoidia bacterium]|nr:hypothetical protein [Dehalococcoidia bacterium]
MRKFKFICSVSFALFLIFLPEPITTGLGIGLLSWSLMHYAGFSSRVSGACRCDACRLGITRASQSHFLAIETPARTSLLSGPVTKSFKIRRAQATLPFIKGRGLTQSYTSSNRWLKGEVVTM